MAHIPRDTAEIEDYEHECRKFRICIIGRAGVGKSTLLGKVFGLNDEDAQVKHRGEGSGKHSIWDPIADDNRNSALIIHDSRGFEAGETENLKTVTDFINYRSKQATLSEQLHCIWYCISLEDVRPLQTAENTFFKFFQDKGIPLVFVLTKFDKLVRDKLDEIAGDEDHPTEWERQRAKQDASSFVEVFRTDLENATGKGVKVQAVSKKDDRLVRKLVIETAAIVKPTLKDVWVRAQGVVATQKRESCVKDLPTSYFKNVLIGCALPFNPFKAVVLDSYFERVFHHCMVIWNLPGQSVLFTKDYITRSFREATQSYTTRASAASIIDLVGPLTAPLYVRLTIKLICDLIIIFQQLFWATPRRQLLTRNDLEDQLVIYRNSSVRQSIHKLVDGSVGITDLVTSFSPTKLKQIVEEVVSAGHVLISEELRSSDTGETSEIPLAELPG